MGVTSSAYGGYIPLKWAYILVFCMYILGFTGWFIIRGGVSNIHGLLHIHYLGVYGSKIVGLLHFGGKIGRNSVQPLFLVINRFSGWGVTWLSVGCYVILEVTMGPHGP
jgi:hypothetical protein